MAGGKWISGLSADTPPADAARRVLTVRLELVRDLLPPALARGGRRPGARPPAARGHPPRPCRPRHLCRLPAAKAYKRAKRELRDLRRAAGEARDWDVFLIDLAERQRKPPPAQRPGLDFLTGHALSRRLAAQDHLLAAGRDQPFASDRLVADTVGAVHRPHDDGAARR